MGTGTIGLGSRCVVLEEDRWIVALCPDCHFALRHGIPALGGPPLEFHHAGNNFDAKIFL